MPRNFDHFLESRGDRPFCFWFGTHEPHRAYEDGAGERSDKRYEDVDVPKFYPDNETIRRDLADYAVESEWFDTHLGRILEKLERIGELDNTLVLVTSDHGMPFPRVKGQIYEYGFHLPLAMRWGGMQGGRKIDDFINVRDFAPTFLELAGIDIPDSMTGKSFADVLRSGDSDLVDKTRNRMLIGKERHDLGRPNDWGLPRAGAAHARVPVRPQLRARPLARRQPRDRLPQLRRQPDEGSAFARIRRVLPHVVRQAPRGGVV